ncbi:right-handed parallel beta-helix repeat-containing protein, partial [Reichenbachiella ulvae]
MKSTLILNCILLAFFLFTSFHSKAQCDCDHTINPSSNLQVLNGDDFNYQPGDTFCLMGGQYNALRLINFKGTAEAPLTFINCDGAVNIVSDQYTGMQWRESAYVRVTGTGDENEEYGIKVSETPTGRVGISVTFLSTDFEIDHTEISGTGFAGIMAKTDPECNDDRTWRENFTMYNIIVRDNYIHDTGGEGMYLGGSFGYETTSKSCDGIDDPFAHFMVGTKVYNNYIEDTGWDGLQVSLGDETTEVYNNTIYGYGTSKENNHNAGIQLGSGCTGKFYNNKVIQKPDYALEDQTGIQIINALSGLTFFNNVVAYSGEFGIWIHLRFSDASIDLDKSYNFINNTIIEPGGNSGGNYGTGIFWNTCIPNGGDCRDYIKNYFANNIIVDPGINLDNSGFWKSAEEAFIDYNAKALRETAVKVTNLFARTTASGVNNLTADIKFADPSNDNYSILEGSTAIDAGTDVSSYGVSFDFNNGARPFGSGFDIGAFEFGATNQAPIASISVDKETINSGETVSLNGTASSDPDGSIIKYAWTVKSGPSSPTIQNADQASATVTINEPGEYVISLEVTD